jgi:predicted SAM-dependent methyltransferase
MRKVNLGCGENHLDGWENYDKDMNITKKLNFDDSSVDFILAEHVFEHITPLQGLFFIRECHRVLKPNGVLRLCVPVIDYVIKRHDEEYLKNHGGNLSNAIELIVGFNGHQAVYTEQLLVLLLEVNGFYCTVKEPQKSDYSELTNVDGHSKVIGEYANWIETVCIEAVVKKENYWTIKPITVRVWGE